MTRKTSQGSPRAKLTADLISAVAKDFAAHGPRVLERMREQNPARYCDLASKLIAASDAPAEGTFASADSMHQIGERLLKSVGLREPSAEAITEAIAANTTFIATLEGIRDEYIDKPRLN